EMRRLGRNANVVDEARNDLVVPLPIDAVGGDHVKNRCEDEKPMPTIADAPPYAGLTPDCVLDALDSVGIRGDGRLLALNSYENRVYQAWRDDAPPAI